MTTKATEFLTRKGIPFSVHAYEYAPDGGKIGLQAAQAIGENPEAVLKTLMVKVDRKQPVCVIIPSNHKLDLKALAALFGGRNARMIAPEEAQTMTGFQVGGISPFGQTEQAPVVIAEQAMKLDHIYVNAGDRGLVVKIAPADAQRAVDAKVGLISAG
ncbi:Cys-tRNA(Pro) deacylase [Acetobacter estunensis]|uniref:Cys-tRNA(Pro) deacylase n=1 Tax=Acetobacter estunensis TaxID=104097 RepID=UPI001C2DB41C|nr:Cys-tRNA(Pro) deacylase [Acetobacter estunensis]MBV1836857.1 Cys-tRNA(Pro) deacylase [Acetobacter estunensis]